ncbi:ABC transporter permease subunit [Haloechinothrix sp. YIM 98757]|uniref:ABC transporter permease subunit n=1 Tax=Haloechinothrix aidingensis TaxID=2752311 RepID=A0A838A7R3_9PSEU|nr:ABC transporter permease subunit [Haloechinothrix aidingensis]MBA0126080.1 ABC transporter permease subunit [Haloechinothrix aidingensis]
MTAQVSGTSADGRFASVLRRPGTGVLVTAILGGWLLAWYLLRGTHTLQLGAAQLTDLHRSLNEVNHSIATSRDTNPVFVYFFDVIRVTVDEIAAFFQALLAQPAFGSPTPLLGWLGVVAVAGFLAYAVGNLRVALLAVGGLVFLGLQGLWQESMDTLALTMAAVLIALLFTIPLGVYAGLSDRFHRLITPVLDFMQTMPTFVYLAPLTLFFLIGPASATIATMIYAAPPTIRLTAHGIRSVPEQMLEASRSLGATRWQSLTKVLLPTAKRTIVLGINQTMMAALAMVTIAALINAPGLGRTVINALQTRDVGTAFNGGLAIVVLAIVIDRVTTAAGTRQEQDAPAGTARGPLARRGVLLATGVLALVGVWYSRTYLWAAEFPGTAHVGRWVTVVTATATEWVKDNFAVLTTGVKNTVTAVAIDPLQALLTESPWWLVTAVVLALAVVIGSIRAAIVAAVCLSLIILTGLWHDAMITLASVLIATALVVALAVVVGVWMGRSPRVDHVIRPVLDAGQTMPPFVYLVPFLALFEATRFTAIIAAVLYASPVAIKIVTDGIRAVSPTTVEAATATGASTWQTITKVQIPMARHALTLAANQGLIYVLSMVVVGGLVGAGALGYDVVAGFVQASLYGKGLAAGVAIVLLGIMLDRITQAAAKRAGGAH